MARRRNHSETINSFDSVADELLGASEEELAAETPAPATTVRAVAKIEAADLHPLHAAAIQAPLATLRERVYMPTSVEVRLDPKQSKTLRRLFDGLDATGALLANGKRVLSPADSIRYLLDQFAAASCCVEFRKP